MQPSLSIFTGGSAFNPTAFALRQLGHNRVDYIIPTSDDGGSSAEILRFFGGPAIGDLRSRLLRLASESTSEARAIKTMLQHRLPSSVSNTQQQHKDEWQRVLNGKHVKWNATISGEYKCTVLRFLRYFDDQVQERQRTIPHLGSFSLRNGSIGNFFFIFLHAVLGILLYFQNKSASGGGSSRYAVKSTKTTSYSSRNMAWFGTVILVFILIV
jgi:hypothetical protein